MTEYSSATKTYIQHRAMMISISVKKIALSLWFSSAYIICTNLRTFIRHSMCVIHISFNWAYKYRYIRKRQKDGLSKDMFCIDKNNYELHAARTTYMYIYIDRKMKLVHILYKNPCISLLLEKERVVSYVKCLDEHINISLKIILIIGCSRLCINCT